MTPQLTRYVSHGVTLLGDTSRPGGVALAFTERTGGVSSGQFASLNLGSHCGDDPASVADNRHRVLEALGISKLAENLVEPKQIHSDRIVIVNEACDISSAQQEALSGADAIVCTVHDIPVMLCFADCVPVILVAPHAFAVVHSGWRGTIERISAKALVHLCEQATCLPTDVLAYIGPHISGDDYEVSKDLLSSFSAEFGSCVSVAGKPCNLDLGAAVSQTLKEAGIKGEYICSVEESTASHIDRFYSYRAEGGKCGRHAAIAFL